MHIDLGILPVEPCRKKLIVDFEGPLSAKLPGRHRMDALPHLGHHIRQWTLVGLEHRIPARRNRYGHKASRNLVDGSHTRAQNVGVFATLVAGIVRVNRENIAVCTIWNAVEGTVLHGTPPHIRYLTIAARFFPFAGSYG